MGSVAKVTEYIFQRCILELIFVSY